MVLSIWNLSIASSVLIVTACDGLAPVALTTLTWALSRTPLTGLVTADSVSRVPAPSVISMVVVSVFLASRIAFACVRLTASVPV